MRFPIHAFRNRALMAVTLTTGLVLPSAVPTQGHAAEAATAGNFQWSGECQIRCADGRCQQYCSTGIVIAFNAFDAKLKAEGELRARASSQGTVVEGTIRVTINLFNFEGHAGVVPQGPPDRGALQAGARMLVAALSSAEAQLQQPAHYS